VYLKFVAIFSLILFLSSCVSPPPLWPDTLPPVSSFQANWKLDVANQAIQNEAEYLLWVQRFYEGFNTVPGWSDMTSQVLARLPEEERAVASVQLAALGAKISGEWAKDNSVRRIDTSTVAIWRDALQESLSRMEFTSYLVLLNQDLAALLGGELAPASITFERYYTDEFDL
jgi:hypothetical protein